MNQEPLQMESCEPPAPKTFGVVARKARVGEAPVFAFVFAFQFIGETLDTPRPPRISQQQIDTNTLLPSVLSYYGYGGHGSVRFLMDTNGIVTDTYTYDAFGNLIASNEVTPNNYLYCGQQWDPVLGLYHNRPRYMAPGIGRLMTMDTLAGNNEDPLSLHKYLYAGDDPVDNDDPSGHDIEGIVDDIDTALSYVAGMSFTESLRLFDPFTQDHGFKYELLASKYTVSKPRSTMSTGAIVENKAGVDEFKKDATTFGESKGYKILRLQIFCHGDYQAVVGNGAQYADLRLGHSGISPFGNELWAGDFQNLFANRFWNDAEIDLEFCHSLDFPQIPQLFLSLAPQADIWGVHGEKLGPGEYGPIYHLDHYP